MIRVPKIRHGHQCHQLFQKLIVSLEEEKLEIKTVAGLTKILRSNTVVTINSLWALVVKCTTLYKHSESVAIQTVYGLGALLNSRIPIHTSHAGDAFFVFFFEQK